MICILEIWLLQYSENIVSFKQYMNNVLYLGFQQETENTLNEHNSKSVYYRTLETTKGSVGTLDE